MNVKYRYTVLTYNFGEYETFREIGNKDPEAEYVLVTDNTSVSSKTWKVIYDQDLDGFAPFDKVLHVRYNCFKYCSTDICVRVDGSIAIKKSLKPLIDIFQEGHYDMCLMPHPIRDNFLDEYKAWIECRGYDKKQAQKCIESMSAKGYDFNYKGIFQLNFSIQRRDAVSEEMNREVMEYIKELGKDGMMERIDQIPFSFVVNTKYSHLKILPVSEQILRSYYMQFYEHNNNVPNMNMFYDYSIDDERYMFNKKVKCLYLHTPSDKVRAREQELQNEIRDVWQMNKQKDMSIENMEGQIRHKDNQVAALEYSVSDMQAYIDNSKIHIEQQQHCIEQQQVHIGNLQNQLRNLSEKNQKHIKQIRVLLILIGIIIIGLIGGIII